jgi:hypothetical protein
MGSQSAPSTRERAQVYFGVKMIFILHSDEELTFCTVRSGMEKMHNRLLWNRMNIVLTTVYVSARANDVRVPLMKGHWGCFFAVEVYWMKLPKWYMQPDGSRDFCESTLASTNAFHSAWSDSRRVGVHKPSGSLETGIVWAAAMILRARPRDSRVLSPTGESLALPDDDHWVSLHFHNHC